MASSSAKKTERLILMLYFFCMLGLGIFFGKILNDIFIAEHDSEKIFRSLGCDKILKEDEFYLENGHIDWIKRCQAGRLPF
jgi:hypothetical protein